MTRQATGDPVKTARRYERGVTALVMHQGGCFTCNGNDSCWRSRNVLALAKRHYIATGHQTWADVAYATTYGRERASSSPTERSNDNGA